MKNSFRIFKLLDALFTIIKKAIEIMVYSVKM